MGVLDYLQREWGLSPLQQYQRPAAATAQPAQVPLTAPTGGLAAPIMQALGLDTNPGYGRAPASGNLPPPPQGDLATQAGILQAANQPGGILNQDPSLPPPPSGGILQETGQPLAAGWQPLRVNTQAPQPPPAQAAPPLPVPPAPPAPPTQAPAAPPTQAPAAPPARALAPAAPVAEAFGPQQRRDFYAAFETGNAQDPYRVQNRAGSSAFGRYQFTEGFYNDLRTRFPQAGLGSWEEFKNSPEMQDRAMDMADGLYRQTAERVGITFTPFVGRAMHFMGTGGGAGFLRAYQQNPQQDATEWVRQTYGRDADKVIQQNPGIYTDASGNARTVGQVYARLQNAGEGGSGGILGGATNPGVPQPQTGQAERLATTDAGIESNPLYQRIMDRLNSRDANDMPLWADLAGRIGTGLLSGNDWQSGFANAGKMALDGVDKRNQRRLQTEDREIGALSGLLGSDLRARGGGERLRQGSPTNIQWRDQQGRLQNRTAEVEGGRMYFRQQDGSRIPVETVTGGDHVIGQRGDRTPFEDGPGGVPGAEYVTDLGNGNVLPTFRFQREGEGRSYSFAMAALGARDRLRQMENSGYDPTRVNTALEHYFSDGGGAGRAIPEILSRLTGLTGPDDREYARQLLLYTNAVGRFESGAQIPETEFSRYRAMFNPGMLTGPDGIRNAQSARDRHLVPLIGSTGAASAYLGQIYSGQRQYPSMGTEFTSGQSADSPRTPTGGAQAATSPQGSGTQEDPIVLRQGARPGDLQDNKHYRLPSGQIASGAQIKSAAAGRN